MPITWYFLIFDHMIQLLGGEILLDNMSIMINVQMFSGMPNYVCLDTFAWGSDSPIDSYDLLVCFNSLPQGNSAIC